MVCRPDLEGGYAAARQLLSLRPQIDALLCYNDLVAVGALQACATAGRGVPEDMAVVGFDDILLAGLVTPPLTTLRSDRRGWAQRRSACCSRPLQDALTAARTWSCSPN